MVNFRRHLCGLASMVLGGSTALASVFAMNSLAPPPPGEEKSPSAEFAVAKEPPPKKEKSKPRKRREVKTSAAPRAPTPQLANAIGGIDFSLPGLAVADFGSLGDQLLGDTTKHTTMTAEVVDELPKPRRRTAPAYPDKARQRGITGYVKLKILLGANGEIGRVRVVEAKPRGVFEEAALAAVRQWEFEPAVYQGSPVETWMDQVVRFELN